MLDDLLDRLNEIYYTRIKIIFLWKLYDINIPDIQISGKFRSFSLEIDSNNRPIRCLRGLYEHLPSDTGGPFVTYIIEDDVKNEVILASGFVNFPENNRRINNAEYIYPSVNYIGHYFRHNWKKLNKLNLDEISPEYYSEFKIGK